MIDTLRELLDYIRANEIGVRPWRGQVYLSPAAKITPELASAVTRHKAELMWLLIRRLPVSEERPPWEVWLDPVVWEEFAFQRQKAAASQLAALDETPAVAAHEAA